jgi:signal transduction histidine kinase
MRQVKSAFNTLFLLVFLLHGSAFFYAVWRIAEEKIRFGDIAHPFVFTCFLSLLWMGLSGWACIRARPQNLEENPPQKHRNVLPGLVAITASLILTGLGLEFDVYILSTFVLTMFVIASLYIRITSALLNISMAVAQVIVFYLFGRTHLIGTTAVLSIITILTTLFLDELILELRKQSAMFDQARWAASEFANVNMRLQDSMDKTEIVTRSSERTRVAREIHDTVGYTLTALLVQINAAQEILRIDPSKLHSRFEKLEKIIRLAISDVRKEVSKLRDDKTLLESWRTRWLRLCNIFADCTGIRIHTDIAENLRSVDDTIGTTIYRIIQEALTNAYRHGRARVVDVAMEWQEMNERILLRISDDGQGAHNPKLGNGLNGIRERIYNLGGEVVLQTKPYRGFDIGITIPWKGEVLDEENTGFGSRRSSLVS